MARQKITLKKLPESLLPVIKEYETARDARRALEAEARAMARTVAQAQAKLLRAFGDARIATCGDLVITLKRGEDIPAALTLKDQSVVPWTDVTSLTLGNTHLDADDVISIYGGRAGSVSLISAPKAES